MARSWDGLKKKKKRKAEKSWTGESKTKKNKKEKRTFSFEHI